MAGILAELQAQKENATGQFSVQCSRVASFSDLSLVLNGVTYTIQPADYVYKSGNGKCYIRFRAHEDKEAQTWILGLPLLTRYGRRAANPHIFFERRIPFFVNSQTDAN